MILEPTSTSHNYGVHEHFRLAARLFTAISGSYDPLNQDLSMELPVSEDEISRIGDFKAAQLVVKQQMWRELNFSCSGDFLKHLFEDRELAQHAGSDGCTGELDAVDFTISPEPYVPDKFDIDSYRQLRCDWDLARRNYTNHVVSIGSKYGWFSEAYTLTEQKWASVEATWKKCNKSGLENSLKNNKVPRTNVYRLESLFERNEEQHQEESFQQPLIYASLQQDLDPPKVSRFDISPQPQKQLPRFTGDMYWPRWIRGQEDSVEEGWCGMCKPGRWLSLDSAFQNDKDFKHGVSAATGKPFDEPREMRRMKGNPVIWWGLCGTCGDWVELLGSKNDEIAWFVHSFGVSIEINI